MAYYRLYFFNLGNGHIDQFHEFEASTDMAAIVCAGDWRDLGAMELWSGGRKVKRWEAYAFVPEARARSAVSALRR
jgi:hypothetical protein